MAHTDTEAGISTQLDVGSTAYWSLSVPDAPVKPSGRVVSRAMAAKTQACSLCSWSLADLRRLALDRGITLPERQGGGVGGAVTASSSSTASSSLEGSPTVGGGCGGGGSGGATSCGTIDTSPLITAGRSTTTGATSPVTSSSAAGGADATYREEVENAIKRGTTMIRRRLGPSSGLAGWLAAHGNFRSFADGLVEQVCVVGWGWRWDGDG